MLTPEQQRACDYLRRVYADRFRVIEEIDGHLWGEMSGSAVPGVFCLFCGFMRRRDKQNSPCRGPVKVALR